jgi:hypothetical protein
MSEEISEIKKKLKEFEQRISKLEKHLQAKSEKESHLTPKQGIEKFAENANLSIEQLGNVFEFNEDDFQFIAPLTESLPEKQVILAQCVLIGLEFVYGKKLIDATELAKKLDDFGLDSHNFARSLSNRSDIFRRIGKKRQTKYKLTDIGKTSAIQLVHTLATHS